MLAGRSAAHERDLAALGGRSIRNTAGVCPAQKGITQELTAVVYGSILVILDPCNPKPAISPCWLKMKA
jgi:hypothetical protein